MLSTPAIAPATSGDRAALESLLVEANLPLDGLDDAFPDGFALARLDGAIVGAAGVERWGEHALLRSVAVAPAQRGRQLAEALVADRIAWARSHVAGAIYLLTLSADRYFERLGFTRLERAKLPAELAGSTQLAIPVCSTAIAMTRRL